MQTLVRFAAACAIGHFAGAYALHGNRAYLSAMLFAMWIHLMTLIHQRTEAKK